MRLADACEAAEFRKQAALGLDDDAESAMTFTTEAQTRAMFSGYDVDYAELQKISERAGRFFAWYALMMVPMRIAAQAAWTDGLLTGIQLERLPRNAD